MDGVFTGTMRAYPLTLIAAGVRDVIRNPLLIEKKVKVQYCANVDYEVFLFLYY